MFDDAKKKGDALHQSLLSPLDKLQAEYKSAMALFAAGALPGDDLGRIQEKIVTESEKTKNRIQHNGTEMANSLYESMATPIDKATEKWQDAEMLFATGFAGFDAVIESWDELQDAIDKADKDALKPFIEQQEKMIERAATIYEATQTPMEKYKDAIAEINDLMMSGFLDDGTAAQAIDAAAQKYRDETKKHNEAKSDFKSAGLQQGSREDLSSIVEAITRTRAKDPQSQTAQATQQVAQNTQTLTQQAAQIQYSLKNIKTWDLGITGG